MKASMLAVTHVSTTDIVGGAGRAAYRLHAGLREAGIASRMLVRTRASRDPDVATSADGRDSFARASWRVLAPKVEDWALRRLSPSGTSERSCAFLPNPSLAGIGSAASDILNLHWVCGGFLAPWAIRRFRHPFVWTLHDMWPFSGTRHYDDEDAWRANSEARYSGVDSYMWRLKAWSYGPGAHTRPAAVVAPSRWLADCARQSAIFSGCRVECIPYGLDHNAFAPFDRTHARRLLNLPETGKLVLFAADGGSANPRKGFAHVLAAMGAVSAMEDVAIVLLGGGTIPDQARQLGLPIHGLGALHDHVSMRAAYAAADVFVAPSLADNLPLTVMEALACGTPVVAFDVGGLPDLVVPETNGLLAEVGDAASLGHAIGTVLALPPARAAAMRAASRDGIVARYKLSDQAAAYSDLYGEILEEAKR